MKRFSPHHAYDDHNDYCYYNIKIKIKIISFSLPCADDGIPQLSLYLYTDRCNTDQLLKIKNKRKK